MRATGPDEELLEPLPVLVDGIWIDPVCAYDDRPVEVWSVRDAIDAARAVVAEAQVVRELPPWHYAEHPVAPTSRPANLDAAFTRMVGLRPARLDSLPAWWRRRAQGDRVEVADRLVLEQPRCDAVGTWRMTGSLRSPWRPRSVHIELWLWPRLGAFTKMTVEPQRNVRVSRRYFSSGHRVLDELCDQLIRELDA